MRIVVWTLAAVLGLVVLIGVVIVVVSVWNALVGL